MKKISYLHAPQGQIQGESKKDFKVIALLTTPTLKNKIMANLDCLHN